MKGWVSAMSDVTVDACKKMVVDEDRVIQSVVPVCIDENCECLTISSEKDGVTLTLIAEEPMQPCIGPQTHTGMSYGRFTLSRYTLKKIVVDRIRVICLPHNLNPNFSIGTYGYREVPIIECINGGSIECPESYGTRLMVDNIQSYECSTKLTGCATYMILEPGQSPNEFMTDEQKALRDEIAEYVPQLAKRIDYSYNIEGLKKLVEVSKLVTVSDPTYWRDRRSAGYYMMLRTCAILQLPLDWAHKQEFVFEGEKLGALIERYFAGNIDFDKFSVEKAIALAMLYELVFKKDHPNEEFRWEYAYEMIPSYYYNFIHGVPHYKNVLHFLEISLDEGIVNMYECGFLQDYVKMELSKYDWLDKSVAESVLRVSDAVEG